MFFKWFSHKVHCSSSSPPRPLSPPVEGHGGRDEAPAQDRLQQEETQRRAERVLFEQPHDDRLIRKKRVSWRLLQNSFLKSPFFCPRPDQTVVDRPRSLCPFSFSEARLYCTFVHSSFAFPCPRLGLPSLPPN